MCKMLPWFAVAQQSIIIDLKTTDHVVFPKSRSITTIAADSVHLLNIPDGIQNYRIKEYKFSEGFLPLRIFYGVTFDGKRQVIFDSDFDGDLHGEYTYFFDALITNIPKVQEDSILNNIRAVSISYPGQSEAIFVKPVVFNRVANYQTTQDSIWHLFVESNYDRKANLIAKGKTYQLYAQGSIQQIRYENQFNFIIVPDGTQNSIKIDRNNPPFKLHEPIVLDEVSFVVDSVTPFLEQAHISIHEIPDIVYGVRQGQYAENIIDHTIDAVPFNLHQLRGHYVLIDFWGSWCNPCIELIPKLRELNDTYKDLGLKMLSIGVDDQNNFDKMRAIIQDERMDWLHVFSAFGDQNALNIQYSVTCFPTTILIDPNGKIIYRGCGIQDFPQIVGLLGELFNLKLMTRSGV